MGAKDLDMKGSQINIEKATAVVKKYFEELYGNLGLLLFRIESVDNNTEPTKWYVKCSFLPSLGSDEKATYLVKVDVSNGTIISVQIEK